MLKTHTEVMSNNNLEGYPKPCCLGMEVSSSSKRRPHMTLLESEDHPEVPRDPLVEAKLSTELMGVVGLHMERSTTTNGKKAVSKGH